MRLSRIKLTGEPALYHCMSRVVGSQYLLGPDEKKFFNELFWKMVSFFDMTVLSHTLMDNHYHHVVRTPAKIKLTDDQLLQKCLIYYGEDGVQYKELKQAIERDKNNKPNKLKNLRYKYSRMIGDISVFEGQLKKRFSDWYNLHNRRKGTLWAERFKSVLAEDTIKTRLSLAIYVDLNPVRAGIVANPKDYEYCCFGEAIKGSKRAIKAICEIMGIKDPEQALHEYSRELMYRGSFDSKGNGKAVDQAALLEVLNNGGQVKPSEVMRIRIRYLIDGVVLGTEQFVDNMFCRNRNVFSKRQTRGACLMNGCDWGELRIIRRLRAKIFG